MLREDKDHAFLIHFDKEVELLRDLTNSKPKLQKAIDELETATPIARQGGGGGYPGGGMGGRGGGGWPGGGGMGGGRRGGGTGGYRAHAGTLLYDAVLLASDEIMMKQKGRKALILMSDGDDSGSKTTMRSAITSAQRSDSLIYAVYFKGEAGAFRGGGGRRGYPQQDERTDGKNVMEQISRETGGAMIAVTGKTHVDQAFTQIGEELRSQYSLGYTSDSKSTESEFRKIVLVSKQPGLTVQTRDGYWSDGE